MAEQRKAKDREQDLYLLFDDWESGYSIRKVSLSRRSGKCAEQPLSSGSGEEGAEPLPEVFMHIRAPRGFPYLFTSAFGSKIVVMHPVLGHTGGVPMIDVQEQTIVVGPDSNYNACPIYFPIGDDRLYALDVGSFDGYLWTPEHSEEQWVWQERPFPPFERGHVSSYAVRPDGCILIRTTESGATFIFDTKQSVWTSYANCLLPFTGRGHYDTSLKGFVGLSEDGYLCCSTMPSTRTGIGHPPPDIKHTKEKVYKNPAERHVSATLVHMRQGKFCLVECVYIDKGRTGQDIKAQWDDEFKVPLGADLGDFVGGGPQGGRFRYCLKTFSLIYDRKGDLKVTHCKVRCYSLPHEARIGTVCQDPVAFWL